MRFFLKNLIFLGLFSTTPLLASLRWEKTEILLTPKSTSASATAEFVFTNDGEGEVVVDQVHPDCNCVTVPLKKTHYNRGESGCLIATFVVGHQTGEHTVPIQVR